jgi:O-antigen/teichoic acid export membrane protein
VTRLLRNVGALYALQVSNYLLPLVSLPLLTRGLGLEGFGRFSVAMAAGQYLSMVTDWSFNIDATRAIAHDGSARNVRRVFWRTQCARCLLGGLAMTAWAAACLLIWNDGHDEGHQRWVYLTAVTSVIATLLTPTWLFQGLQRLELSSMAAIVTRIVGVGLLALYVHDPSDDALAVLITNGATAAGGLVAMAVIARRGELRFERFDPRDSLRAIGRGASVFGSLLISTAYVTATIPVVRLLTSEAAAGAYAAAERLVRTVTTMPMPISQAIFPEMARRLGVDLQSARGLMRRTLVWMGGIGGAATLALVAGAPVLVQVLFGSRYADAAQLIQLLAPLPFLIAVSNVIGLQILLACGRRRAFAGCLMLGAFGYLASVAPLTSHWGTAGAAMAVVLAELLVTASMAMMLFRGPPFHGPVAEGTR